MGCPECKSSHFRKNGMKRGKQNHICVNCSCQFIDCYEKTRGYENEMKRECLKMYVNGTGFRGIEQVKGDQIICKTYMTRVEGENTRLRHYLARLHKNFMLFEIHRNAQVFC